MHGYELRKRVTGLLGWGRVLSYGSLYPCLKQMLRDGWIAEDVPDSSDITATSTRSGKSARTAKGVKGAKGMKAKAARVSVVAEVAPRAGRRGKIVYKLTAEGKERFADLVSAAGPSAWEDDNFGVHFAF